VCSFQLFSQSFAFILFKKDKYYVCSFQLFSHSLAFILFKKDKYYFEWLNFFSNMVVSFGLHRFYSKMKRTWQLGIRKQIQKNHPAAEQFFFNFIYFLNKIYSHANCMPKKYKCMPTWRMPEECFFYAKKVFACQINIFHA
jgi:hypothetical protein